jgi:hypothetical protein
MAPTTIVDQRTTRPPNAPRPTPGLSIVRLVLTMIAVVALGSVMVLGGIVVGILGLAEGLALFGGYLCEHTDTLPPEKCDGPPPGKTLTMHDLSQEAPSNTCWNEPRLEFTVLLDNQTIDAAPGEALRVRLFGRATKAPSLPPIVADMTVEGFAQVRRTSKQETRLVPFRIDLPANLQHEPMTWTATFSGTRHPDGAQSATADFGPCAG